MLTNKYLNYLIFVLFLVITIVAVYTDIGTITKKINNIELVHTKLSKILLLRELVQDLQKERGLTNIYYSRKNILKYKLLLKQREETQASLKNKMFSQVSKDVVIIRKVVDGSSLSQKKVFDTYTQLILEMLVETKKLLIITNDQKIKNYFYIYQNTNLLQEYLGELRAKIGAVLESSEINEEQYILIVRLQTLVNHYILQVEENIVLTDLYIAPPLKEGCFIQTREIISKIVQHELPQVKVSSMEWFKLSTCAINLIEEKMTDFLSHINNEIDTNLKGTYTKLYYHIFFWILIISFLVSLLKILFHTNKKMLVKQKVLEDYKKAIDNSTIVSKTDKRGIITYTNKAFCEISGYTEEELLGKPHSMVRHPSTDKRVFQDLWKTIESGKTWQGQIVNLAKDQTEYWVNATISPIYDNENNLIEYIAIRHDITQIVELNKEIKNTQYELIHRMGESVESRSKESGHHIQRVAEYSRLLAQLYQLSPQEVETIFIASAMHDIGKIAIPDDILLKRGKLDKEEWEIMQTHSDVGYRILEGSNLPILKMAANIAYEHHEHYNGKGYPRGIKEEEISIYSRIVSIADVFDALISDRVYKEAWPLEKVVTLLQEESSQQFDPELVKLFLENIDQFMDIRNQYQ